LSARFGFLLLFGDLAGTACFLGTDWGENSSHGHHYCVAFVQDPCARSHPTKPGLMVEPWFLLRVFSWLSAHSATETRQLDDATDLPGQRQLTHSLPFFFVSIGLQGLFSCSCVSDLLLLTMIGYRLSIWPPFLGLWMGYQVGLEPESSLLTQTCWFVYLAPCFPFPWSSRLAFIRAGLGLLVERSWGGGFLNQLRGFLRAGRIQVAALAR